ncbi:MULTISPECIES: DUF2750 domain-containing protein [Flavobacterium]|uniref:DUF2750 domain-containing protein n=2 Tax=Flavobacterium TaxID=237 RepID=A0AA94F2J2_9FLAO|nr:MULTISPECIES: DUF2750 domain-containing protein [Flavobacterium]MCH4828200.1 DUF2750 domain-containing protein [Flavobacterium columnare]MCH4828459.1 DUF2750 domain-containing protein [Flavobacterium columnare]MCH4829746.1 DUF2750 domain-containing protein [Flavobacterium columnare]MCH4829756.1 DUF2750 domain-containing protein [Flavobacterium columnare]MCH4829767.1 DUF2750 domain-containing protein [Flavobacterium columnare]
MNAKEIKNVSVLQPIERYKYFIKKVADYEELWTIVDVNGDYALSDIDDKTLISFWSAKEFINSNLEEGWKECTPKKLTLDDLEDEIFDLIASKNYLIDVFPVNGKSGFVVDLDEFARDLSEELKNY